ncbi:MAG: N-acetylmuramoyl-L-alanine amidase [Actinomycetota bacterium]|nr:N-acetylmuramoyl-L-alanine amidase [Actinomycetota bacterium]
MTLPRAASLALVVSLLLVGPASAGVRVVSRDEPLPPSAPEQARAAAVRTLAPRLAPSRFNLAGVQWRGRGQVWFRTASARGGWTAWRPARPEAEDRPDPGSPEAGRRPGWKLGNPYWTGSATWIQYRLVGPVARLRAYFLWSPLRPGTAPVRRAVLVPGRPRIIMRAQWGADESIVRAPPSYAERVAFSVVHHTAGAPPSSPAQSAAMVRGVLAYHVRSNGWNDIAYNYLVDPFGQIFEGRRGGVTRPVVGAHARGFNTGSTGVALLGNYDSRALTAAAREALVKLLAWRLDVAHVDPASRLTWTSAGSPKWPAGRAVVLRAVSGHRDVGLTACPGANAYAKLGAIAAAAAAYGGPKLFDPRARGSVGGRVRITARLSTPLPWTVTVVDASGRTLASGAGSGTAVDWTWDASRVAPGRYSYAIEAGPNVRAARGAIKSPLPLELTRLALDRTVVTPNGDGVGDAVHVAIRLTIPAAVSLSLADASGRPVATVVSTRAVRAGTTTLVWRGRTTAGSPVADGRYALVVSAAAGSQSASARTGLVVDRTLGYFALRPRTFSPNGDGRRERVTFSYRLERSASVRLRILAGSRPVATVVSARQGGPASLAVPWDGTSGGVLVADGRLRALVEATTSLGTRILAGTVTLDTTPPRIARLRAIRTRGGTLVTFRLSERARIRVRFGSRTVRISSGRGRVSIWRRLRPPVVAVSARDAAGIGSRVLTTRVRR